jgi:hypothetical protein
MIRAGTIPAEPLAPLGVSSLSSQTGHGRLELLVTDLPGGFQSVADLFLGEHTPEVEQIDLVLT